MESPGFSNAIMKKIMEEIPSYKYNGNLIDWLRYVYNFGDGPETLLRRLCLDSAVFWLNEGFSSPSVSIISKDWWSTGLFNKDHDFNLVEALKKHQRQICPCREDDMASTGHLIKGSSPVDGFEDPSKQLRDSPFEFDISCCDVAPWLDHPTRYLYATPKSW